MTDEQKEQLAKEYAENEYKIGDAAYDKAMANLIERVYLDALDARDEEVDELQAKIDEATKLEKSMAYNIEHLNADMAQLKYENTTLLNQCEEQRGFIAHLKAELDKVKNPWHKTDDDSPKEGVHYQMKDGEFLYGKPMLLHICEDDDDIGDDYKGYFDGKFWRYWDKPMSCDVVRGKVTHWMPIPQVLKGGEK